MPPDLPNTAAFEPQVGTFAAPNLTLIIGPYARADVWQSIVAPVSRTLTANLRKGGSLSMVIPVGFFGPIGSFDGRIFTSLVLSATAPNEFWALVAQDQPVFTWPVVGQTGAPVQVSGIVTVELLDGAGNTIVLSFGNGTAAPATGLASVMLTATTGNAVTLSDGTTTKTLIADTTGIWKFFQFPVKAGVTYTLAGTGLALLGPGISIGPG